MKRYYPEATASLFIVGLGQILKGDSQKGVLLLLFYYLALPALVYASLAFSGLLFIYILGISIIGGTILWLYNIIDALKTNI